MRIAQSAAWINLLFRRLLFLMSETALFGSILGHFLWQPLIEWFCLSWYGNVADLRKAMAKVDWGLDSVFKS